MSQPENGIQCPNCGASNRADAHFCKSCSAQLTSADPAPISNGKTLKLPNESKLHFHQRATQRLGTPTGFMPLPVGALIKQEYEVREVHPPQAGFNSYSVIDSENQFGLLFEAESAAHFMGERTLYDRRVNHPAIARLADMFEETQYEDQSRSYLLTEFPIIPLSETGTPNEFDVLSWGAHLAAGLEYLHGMDLALGNIQAANLIMDGSKQVKLWNFASLHALTTELRDLDIQQLAKTLFMLATPSNQAAPAFSPSGAQVFARALSNDPRQRYGNATAYKQDLEKAIDALRHPQLVSHIAGGMTDVGKKRELNEDALVIIEVAQFAQQGSQTLGLYAVADGMGGAAAGEVASRMVTQELARQALGAINQHFQGQPAHLEYGEILKSAVEKANENVFQARSNAHNDMGSTLVAALIVGNQAHIANVGDSRAYCIAPDRIERITKDHSLVQTFVDRNEISEDDVYTHPQRNFIMRNVGDKPQIKVDLYTHTFEPGQYLLLCSDGMWEMVYPKDRLREIVIKSPSVQDACKKLIQAANDHGGDDNITVVLVKFESI